MVIERPSRNSPSSRLEENEFTGHNCPLRITEDSEARNHTT
jgi:hypothetical protein